MKHPESGTLLVNLLETQDMTAGRCYRLMRVEDGHSGCGAQTWYKVADDRGVVIGFDPDRFIEAASDRVANPVALKTATRMLRRCLKLVKGISKDGFMSALYSSLKDQVEDAQSIIAATALDPNAEQITLVQDEDTVFKPATIWKIQADTSHVATLTGYSGRGRANDLPAYDLEFAGAETRLKAKDFNEARAEVIQVLTNDRMARSGIDRDFGVWATGRWMDMVKAESVPA